MHNGNPEESYISAVLRQIQWKKARPVIQKELEGHIEEHLREVKNSGLDDTASMEVSVKAMGDPLETGRRLDRLHRPRVDVLMLISVAILITFPLALIIYSITAQYNEPNYIQGLATTAIGFGIGIACVLADIRRIIRIASLPLVIGSLVGLLALYLVYMLYLRNSPNHMTSFPNSIYFWFYTVLDCCLLVFLAGFSGLAARTKRGDTRANILAVATATVATVLIFMMHKYNLVCTVFACFFMLLFSGADKKWKAVFSAVLVGVTVFICLEFLDDAAEANEASHITSLFKTAMQHLKDLKLIGHATPELIGIISAPASYISSAFSQPFGYAAALRNTARFAAVCGDGRYDMADAALAVAFPRPGRAHAGNRHSGILRSLDRFDAPSGCIVQGSPRFNHAV